MYKVLFFVWGWTRRSKEHAAEQTPFQVVRPKKLVSLTLRSSDIVASPIFKINLANLQGPTWLVVIGCLATSLLVKPKGQTAMSHSLAQCRQSVRLNLFYIRCLSTKETHCTNQRTKNMKRNNIVAIVEL